MRVVLDTDVVISSLWGGAPGRILDACRRGRALVLVSPAILEEYLTVLARFDVPDEDMDLFAALFADPERTRTCFPVKRLRLVKEDPADDKFLECAAEGRADAIVTGDKHLLSLGSFEGVPVLSVRAFLARLKSA